MKITQELHSRRETGRPSVQLSGREGERFAALVEKGQSRIRLEGLDRLYADIEKQAERVVRSRTITDFLQFKRKVQQFMKEAVASGLELHQSRDWHRSGGTRKHTTVRQIDEKLTEMTEAFLNEKQPAMNLLAQIGEIQGMLINLYR